MIMPGAVVDAIDAFVPPLLGTFDRVEWVQRRLFPSLAPQLADELAPDRDVVAARLHALQVAPWPEDFGALRERLVDVGRRTVDLVTAFVEAARGTGHPIETYRALRPFAALQETLYPLAGLFELVGRWFLEPARRDDDEVRARLNAPFRTDGLQRGVLHAGNERDRRGGFSLYVPEWCDGRTAMPLVVALHGGHGHGRDFLWAWLRDARSRGAIVLTPTSRDRTWSIMSREDVDAAGVFSMVAFVRERYPVDDRRVLLTGMSDGATYTFLLGLGQDGPFTHLAPACGVLHPLLLDGRLARARDLPIYLIHGALDWMFPSSRPARAATSSSPPAPASRTANSTTSPTSTRGTRTQGSWTGSTTDVAGYEAPTRQPQPDSTDLSDTRQLTFVRL